MAFEIFQRPLGRRDRSPAPASFRVVPGGTVRLNLAASNLLTGGCIDIRKIRLRVLYCRETGEIQLHPTNEKRDSVALYLSNTGGYTGSSRALGPWLGLEEPTWIPVALSNGALCGRIARPS